MEKRIKVEQERFQLVAAQTAKLTNKFISASCIDAYLRHWKGIIQGPQTSCYSGGNFSVDIQLPANYPLVPPLIRFNTRIWHPNIDSTNGDIRLDILKSAWQPSMTLCMILTMLHSLMALPNPYYPQDMEAAKMFKLDYA